MTDWHGLPGAVTAVLLASLLAGCGHADPPVFDKNVNVGLAPSSPGWDVVDSAGNRSGFDYDLSNWLGEHLGFTPVPVTVIARDRETELQRGTLTLVVSSYSITDERRKKVGFAGPYMLGQQGVMVRKADLDKYHRVDDLGGKTICVVSNSTSEKQVHDLGFSVTVVEHDVNDQCRHDLTAGLVDAVSTDQLLLYGFAQVDQQVAVPDNIVFGQQERWGIGLPKGDTAQCEAVRAKLKEFLVDGFWEKFFSSNLPGVPVTGHKPNPNRLDECDSG
jgi:glutamate transport system substrate-binding protein